MFLYVVCSWCGRVMGVKEAGGSEEPQLPVTHSICCECKRKLEEETEAFLQSKQKKQ